VAPEPPIVISSLMSDIVSIPTFSIPVNPPASPTLVQTTTEDDDKKTQDTVVEIAAAPIAEPAPAAAPMPVCR
jgi:hypothetical protein